MPDLIVWPETMFPMGYVEIEDGLDRAEFARQVASINPDGSPPWWRRRAAEGPEILGQWVELTGVPMLFGINTYHFRREGLGRYNTALLMRPGGGGVQMYHKLHLVPFGEYVPLVETVPWVLALTPFDADRMPGLQPGPGPTALEVGPWRLAAAICFEDSVPQVARALVAGNGDRPPDVLLNLSNDGWFRGTAAHRLHLANSVLRAVELRVPVARAVNTGISAVIDGDGRVLEALARGGRGRPDPGDPARPEGEPVRPLGRLAADRLPRAPRAGDAGGGRPVAALTIRGIREPIEARRSSTIGGGRFAGPGIVG